MNRLTFSRRGGIRLVPALLLPTVLASCLSASYTLHPAELPADLDAWLAAKEAAVPGLLADNRKQIEWSDSPGRTTPYSIVYLHGWQGSSRDYASVLRAVARKLGANLYFARLKGYSVTTDEIARVTLSDWIADTWEAMQIGQRIGQWVIVVGSSMGGDLALWLATQHPQGLSALVLLSPAVQPKDGRAEMLLWPWPIPQIMLAVAVGRYAPLSFDAKTYPTGSPELFARYFPKRYRSESYLKLMGVVKLTRTLPLADITTPSLWLYCDADDAVDIPSLKRFYARTGGEPRRLVRVERAHSHILAGDIFSPDSSSEVTGDILSFLSETGIAAAAGGASP